MDCYSPAPPTGAPRAARTELSAERIVRQGAAEVHIAQCKAASLDSGSPRDLNSRVSAREPPRIFPDGAGAANNRRQSLAQEYDVIVVGKGNAALCAALSAREQGASVLMLEAAAEDESGGNSRFAGGVMRFAYETVDDLKRVTELTAEEVATSDFGTNTKEEFLDDLYRLTSFRTD